MNAPRSRRHRRRWRRTSCSSRSRPACCASASSRPRPGGCRPTSSTPACSTTAPSWAAWPNSMHAACSPRAWQFDMLFGPAYKGITLAAAVAIELARLGRNVPFAYNRKEAKDHGEGGTLVGAPVARPRADHRRRDLGRHLGARVDRHDPAAGATPCGVAIALDRQEKAAEDGGDAAVVGGAVRAAAAGPAGGCDCDAGRPAAVPAAHRRPRAGRALPARGGLPRPLRRLNA